MWQTGGWWNTKQGEISPPALGNRQVWLPASVFPLKMQSWQRELTLPCAFAAGDILLFFFQTQNNKIWRSQSPRVSRNRWSSSCISVPNLCCSHRAAVMCLCCTPRFLIYTARKRAGDTFLHLLKGMRLADSLSPGFIFIGNPRQSRSWKSQSPKSSRSLQPSCQDWAALSWFHLLLTSLNVWPITECLRAPWGKLPTHTKTQKQTPAQGREKKRSRFNEKES